MATISNIRERVKLIPDDDVRDVCLRVIDEVAERAKRRNQGLWTVEVISRWADKPPEDPAVLRGLQFLVSKIDSQLLEMHFFFVDPEQDGGVDGKIDDEEVAEAFRSGYLIHPVSGREIKNFEGMLLPYFVPAHNLSLQ